LDQVVFFQNDVRAARRPGKALTDALVKALDASCGRYGRILRSKGFCWIAGRDSHTAGWRHAGRLVSLPPMIPWDASVPEEDWDAEENDDLAAIKSKFDGEHGDRRQEIVFIGTGLQPDEITSALNGCLLTDVEMLSHTYSCDGKYYDPLPPWTFHYVEPCVMATVLRPGQAHKFVVHDGVGLTLSSAAAMNMDVEEGRKPVVVRLWADFVTEDNQRTSSNLIATLRSGSCEQHSFQLLLPGTDSEDHNGPRVLRTECATSSDSRKEDVEVHVAGYVSLLPSTERDHDEEENDDDEHRHHQSSKGRKNAERWMFRRQLWKWNRSRFGLLCAKC
jgi:Cobalamin synthesis protein cobW C-terminal domain